MPRLLYRQTSKHKQAGTCIIHQTHPLINSDLSPALHLVHAAFTSLASSMTIYVHVCPSTPLGLFSLVYFHTPPFCHSLSILKSFKPSLLLLFFSLHSSTYVFTSLRMSMLSFCVHPFTELPSSLWTLGVVLSCSL